MSGTPASVRRRNNSATQWRPPHSRQYANIARCFLPKNATKKFARLSGSPGSCAHHASSSSPTKTIVAYSRPLLCHVEGARRVASSRINTMAIRANSSESRSCKVVRPQRMAFVPKPQSSLGARRRQVSFDIVFALLDENRVVAWHSTAASQLFSSHCARCSTSRSLAPLFQTSATSPSTSRTTCETVFCVETHEDMPISHSSNFPDFEMPG